jgi:hypothetical protein
MMQIVTARTSFAPIKLVAAALLRISSEKRRARIELR